MFLAEFESILFDDISNTYFVVLVVFVNFQFDDKPFCDIDTFL